MENLLDRFILNYQTSDTVYERISFQIASENQKLLAKFHYDIPFKKGRNMGPTEDPNQILGVYTFRFTKENSRRQLTLRIQNFVGPPKQDYWIDGILNQPLQMVVEEITIELLLSGLTLNWVYHELYDYFDEIIQ